MNSLKAPITLTDGINIRYVLNCSENCADSINFYDFDK